MHKFLSESLKCRSYTFVPCDWQSTALSWGYFPHVSYDIHLGSSNIFHWLQMRKGLQFMHIISSSFLKVGQKNKPAKSISSYLYGDLMRVGWLTHYQTTTRGPWWPWNRSPEPCGLCGIALKSWDLNHKPLVTSISSSMNLWFDLVTYFFTKQDSFSDSSEISSRQIFRPSFMSNVLKSWKGGVHKVFLRFDLVT